MDKRGKLDSLYRMLGVILMIAMFITVSLQVISRNFLPLPLPWTEELGSFLLIWLVAVGSGIYWKQGGYRAAVDFIIKKLNPRLEKAINALFAGISLWFLIMLAYTSIEMVMKNINVRTTVLEIPMSLIYLAVTVMAVLTIEFFVPYLIEQIKGLKKG